jgi:uncharacterized protein YqfB (UPF0267 family)
VVAYSFQQRFAPPILSGTKQQTIRADRKRHARPGEEMQLYTGMRTKQCELICRTTCISVVPITIEMLGEGSVRFEDWVFRPLHGIDAFARFFASTNSLRWRARRSS